MDKIIIKDLVAGESSASMTGSARRSDIDQHHCLC
jgi:hypothetical protein